MHNITEKYSKFIFSFFSQWTYWLVAQPRASPIQSSIKTEFLDAIADDLAT